jgi:hypothetical protein
MVTMLLECSEYFSTISIMHQLWVEGFRTERNNRGKEGMALWPFSELLALNGLLTALFQTSISYITDNFPA